MWCECGCETEPFGTVCKDGFYLYGTCYGHQKAESCDRQHRSRGKKKGNALVKETFPLLKECEDINFVGSIEAREIPHGYADVIVCEAFTGNVILKLYEGVASTLMSAVKQGMMSSLKSKIGALMVKPALKSTLKQFDTAQYGGAPLLGLNGLVVKTHGSSKAKAEIKNTILQCAVFQEQDINQKIKTYIVQKQEEQE